MRNAWQFCYANALERHTNWQRMTGSLARHWNVKLVTFIYRETTNRIWPSDSVGLTPLEWLLNSFRDPKNPRPDFGVRTWLGDPTHRQQQHSQWTVDSQQEFLHHLTWERLVTSCEWNQIWCEAKVVVLVVVLPVRKNENCLQSGPAPKESRGSCLTSKSK